MSPGLWRVIGIGLWIAGGGLYVEGGTAEAGFVVAGAGMFLTFFPPGAGSSSRL